MDQNNLGWQCYTEWLLLLFGMFCVSTYLPQHHANQGLNSNELSTILTLQDLERSRSLWPHVGPGYCSCGVRGYCSWAHVYCLSGARVLFKWGPRTIQVGPAYKIYLIIFYIKNYMILYTAFTCSSSTVCIL